MSQKKVWNKITIKFFHFILSKFFDNGWRDCSWVSNSLYKPSFRRLKCAKFPNFYIDSLNIVVCFLKQNAEESTFQKWVFALKRYEKKVWKKKPEWVFECLLNLCWRTMIKGFMLMWIRESPETLLLFTDSPSSLSLSLIVNSPSLRPVPHSRLVHLLLVSIIAFIKNLVHSIRFLFSLYWGYFQRIFSLLKIISFRLTEMIIERVFRYVFNLY